MLEMIQQQQALIEQQLARRKEQRATRSTTLHEKIIDTEQYAIKSLQRVHDESESPVNASEQLEQNITSMTEKVIQLA